jgi:hypothetical protein
VSMSSRRPWSEGELSLLKELVGRNVSLPVMALKLGRSVAAIEAKAAQQNIAISRTKRPYDQGTNAEPDQRAAGRG